MIKRLTRALRRFKLWQGWAWDMGLLLGVGAIATGIWWWSRSWALVFTGTALSLFCLLGARGARRVR